MIRQWIEKKLSLPAPMPASLSTCEALCFLLQKGLGPYLRGLFYRGRFKSCGGRLFLGKSIRFSFPSYITLGRDVFIGENSSVSGLSQEGILIGDHVRIRENAWIQATSRLHEPGAGASIGDNTYIGPNVYLGAGGRVRIGKNVVMGAYIQILAENHEFDQPGKTISEQGVTRKGIVIEDDVWIGNLAVILDGVSVGRGSVIGAGSVVTKNVPPYSVAAGNPARVIRERKH